MLPAFHEGAYLYLGDIHASEGDSEFYGVADESRAEVTVSCDVVRNKVIPAPRIETSTSVIHLHSFRPLDDAIMQASRWLMDWMVQDYGVSPREAYMHMDLNVGVEIPKKYLENA